MDVASFLNCKKRMTELWQMFMGPEFTASYLSSPILSVNRMRRMNTKTTRRKVRIR